MLVRTRHHAGFVRPGLESPPLYPTLSVTPLFKTSRLVALIAAIVAIATLAVAGGARAADSPDASYLVTFVSGTSASEQEAAISAAGATDVSSVDALRLHNVMASTAAADALRADSSVA